MDRYLEELKRHLRGLGQSLGVMWDTLRDNFFAEAPEEEHAHAVHAVHTTPFDRWKTWFLRNRELSLLALGTVVVLLLVVSGTPEAKPVMKPMLQEMTVSDSNFSSRGQFYLESPDGVDPDYIYDNMTLYPRAEFTVNSSGENRVLVRVKNYVNAPYTITINMPDGDPLVLSVNAEYLTVRLAETGGDMSTMDPVILSFSEPVDELDLRSALVLKPDAHYTLTVTDATAILTPVTGWSRGTDYYITIEGFLTGVSGKRMSQSYTTRFKPTVSSSSGTSSSSSASSGSSSSSSDSSASSSGSSGSSSGYNSYSEVSFVTPQNTMWRADEPIVWEFASPEYSDDTPVMVQLYRLENIEKYRDQARIFQNYDIDLSVLERVDSNAYLIKPGTTLIPETNPGLGSYVAEFTWGSGNATTSRRYAFMVTDLSVYMQSSPREALVWVNSYSTGNPLSQYTVTFTDGENQELTTGVTDASGVVVLRGATGLGSYYGTSPTANITIEDAQGNVVYADRTNVLRNLPSGGYDRYYSYLYLDRAIYKPTDTISFWGVVKPHHQNHGELPETVFVALASGGETSEIQEVELDTNGVFYGEFELDEVKSSQYRIYSELRFVVELEEDEEEEEEQTGSTSDSENEEDEEEEEKEIIYTTHYLDTVYIDVKEYVKPTYQLSANLDQEWYTPEQSVQVKAIPAFYDGTPLPNFPIEYQVYQPGEKSWGPAVKATTDETGVATLSFPVVQEGQNVSVQGIQQGAQTVDGIARQQNQVMVRIAADGETVTQVLTYNYFPTNIRLTGSFTERPGNLRYDLSVRRLPEYQLMGEEQRGNDRFAYGAQQGAALTGAEVSIRIDWRGSEDYGRYYRGTKRGTTVSGSDGVAVLEELFEDFNLWSYFEADLTATYEDAFGNTVVYTDFFWYSTDAVRRYDIHVEDDDEPEEEEEKELPVPDGFYLYAYNGEGENVTQPYYEYMTYDTVSFDAGEQMRFELNLERERVENPRGRILYTLIQDGMAGWGVVQGDVLTLPQTSRNADSVNLVVAWFDGAEVYPVRNMVISLNEKSLELNIEVTPDQESYRPGGTVRLQVRATDQNGAGVAGSMVVSVVDESIFALKEQYITLLSDLYGEVRYSFDNNIYINKYTTRTGDYALDGRMGDGGKGGGGAYEFYDSYRSNFKDTAAFIPVRTDAAGNATVTFELPDNTTSWRVTTLAVGDNLYAGNDKDNIISTLPFFISPVASSKYIVGDDIAMLVQGHGTLLQTDDEIAYSVRITGDGVDETIEEEGVAWEPKQINFGPLPMGEYTLVSTARYSGYSDTVEQTFAVINSNLELVIHKQIDITETLDIAAVRYPVVLTIYDEANQAFYESIGSLMGHYCMIANQRMSRFVAKRALIDRMDPDDIPYYILDESNDSASNMQNPDGGIGWSVGDPSEPLLTTRVLLVAMDQFKQDDMVLYFRNQLRTAKLDNMDRAASYLGLAALGQDITDDVIAILDEERLDLASRAYLIAALSYAGADAEAAERYEREFAEIIEKIPLGTLTDRENGALSSIWVASSVISQDDADTISVYLAQNPWRIESLFECMIYVANYSKQVNPRSITYSVGGVTRTVSLGLQGVHTLSLNRSEFESLRFINPSDGVKAMAYFVGEPGELDIIESEYIDLEKTIEKLDDENYKITISLGFEAGAPTGQYDISEWIPSNLRLYSTELPGNVYYTDEDQKLFFTYQRPSGAKPGTIHIVYYARKAYDSEAVVDSTYVIHGNSGENAATEKTILPTE